MILGAAIIHEVGHLVAAAMLGIRIKCIRLDIMGAMIETDPLLCSYKKEVLLSLAGPIMNIFSIALSCIIPFHFDLGIFEISSGFFAAINLLPAKDFDGGRALSCLLLSSKISHSAATAFIEATSFVCVFLLWTISVYFIMRTGSYLSLFVFSGSLFAKLFLLPERQT